MNTLNALAAAAVAACTLATAAPAHAEPVTASHAGLAVNANLEVASPGGLTDGAVLLVHGTLAHHGMEIIATLQQLLAERGVNSLAVTLSLAQSSREGMYDCATPHLHRHQDAVAEIGHWVDWLAARGAGPITLAGHSRGGNQAARYALAHPERIAALVLIAPATWDPARTRAAYERRYGVPLDLVLEQARGAAPDAPLSDVGFLYCGPSTVSASSFLSYYEDDGLLDTPSLLPRIAVPTRVIAGSADDTVPDVAERAAPHLDADTTLLVVDGAGHFFRDLYAEDVADAIADAVREARP